VAIAEKVFEVRCQRRRS